MSPRIHSTRFRSASRRGSVLIIVMWICVGLVALTLAFANSMSAELRAADNRANDIAAGQAVAGGIQYAAHVLRGLTEGAVPYPDQDYQTQSLPVGDAMFWFIGRDPNAAPTTQPVFSLVDEASKLNLNTASSAMLLALPGMTQDLADAIIAWRNPNGQSGSVGSANNTYAALTPPRLNKGAPFQSIDELRLVYGATLDVLLGEDANRNGALDANEDDGDQSAPRDDHDGVLQPGIWEYVTVFSRQPNTRPSGATRVNITTPQLRQPLAALLERHFGAARGATLLANIGNRVFNSVAEFMVASRMTADEFRQIHTEVTHASGTSVTGLVNVNTASATVLGCIPGIGPQNAASIVAYRTAHPDALTSFAWLAQVLTQNDLVRAGPYITDQSYQFSADVAAVGRFGRGYAREKVVFDLSNGAPRIIYHQDLAQYGWALGSEVRQALRAQQKS